MPNLKRGVLTVFRKGLGGFNNPCRRGMGLIALFFVTSVACALGQDFPVGKFDERSAEQNHAEEKLSHDNRELVASIRQVLTKKAREAPPSEKEMKSYTERPELAGGEFKMLPIPAGTCTLGSPAGEKGRRDDEIQIDIRVDAFWMGQHEVSWDIFKVFISSQRARYHNGRLMKLSGDENLADLVSQPTIPYIEMSFGMGEKGYPAICMTQHAANKYCQWLTAQTGHFYRLPTEAEWEYACRAGTTTAYSFGDDTERLGDFAWSYKNSDYQYQPIGKKKPNPWGLYDMHGNVAEWCLDHYSPERYPALKAEREKGLKNPWNRGKTVYPRVVRGGSWDHDPEDLRSAARGASTSTWKDEDPTLPRSMWFHTDALTVGFRLVRPLKVPTEKEMYDAWFLGVAR